MGAFFSKPGGDEGGESGLGPDPRPLLPYSSLQFLDLVLIRSAAGGSGAASAQPGHPAEGMDARIASAIRQGALGLSLPAETLLSKWDRVGLIQLPSFLERFEYDADNVEVTEATYTGVQTRSLRAVMDSACEVAIRPLYVGRQIKEIMKRRRRVQQTGAGAGAAAAAAEEQEERKDSANGNGRGAASGSSGDSPDDAAGDENNDRLPFLHRYYQFTGALVNRPYGACMDKLEAMFRMVMASFRRFDLASDPALLARMDALLERHVEDYVTPDGRALRGIAFERMIPVFRDMTAAAAASGDVDGDGPVLHSFTDAELYELVASFTIGGGGSNAQDGGRGGHGGGVDDRVSLSNEGHISKADFMAHWRASLERSLPLRRIPREILSGAFVTQALQHMGLLPPPPPPPSAAAMLHAAAAASAADDPQAAAFLPIHFAMQEPPPPGWDDAADAAFGHQKMSRKEQEKARQVRAALREQDKQRWAHLPVLGPPPPSAAALAAAASAPSSASASSSSHASISVSSADFDAELELEREGLAVLHIHAHGVARIGVEHQLPPPPPLPELRGTHGSGGGPLDARRDDDALRARG